MSAMDASFRRADSVRMDNLTVVVDVIIIRELLALFWLGGLRPWLDRNLGESMT